MTIVSLFLKSGERAIKKRVAARRAQTSNAIMTDEMVEFLF